MKGSAEPKMPSYQKIPTDELVPEPIASVKWSRGMIPTDNNDVFLAIFRLFHGP
jgi:hypothetical protein